MKYQDIYPHLRQPILNPLHWALTIGGMARHPLILSYSDLQQFRVQSVACAVLCAGSPFDESLIEQAEWTGVPVSLLLDELEIDSGAAYAVLHSASGYSTSLPLDWLRRGILALHQDGSLLQPEQGYPARLIVPGLYGYKMPRWITRIELTHTPSGFWEGRGWTDDGAAPITAAITQPRPHAAAARGEVLLQGFAYSSFAPLNSVEISVDGADWMPVDYLPVLPARLSIWRAAWSPPRPGEYHIRARAAAADSTASAAPHSLIVSVTE